jgi:dipeptidyl aminopeptidase/acylaminoacyl peptidase
MRKLSAGTLGGVLVGAAGLVGVAGLMGLTLGSLGGGIAVGQAAIKYQKPPAGIETLLEAPATPVARVSPDGTMLALEQPEIMSSIAELSEPRLRLAGLRFNPLTNGQTAEEYATALMLEPVKGGAAKAVTGLPPHAKILYVQWSPDGKTVAFVQRQDGGPGGLPRAGLELFAVSAAGGEARRLGTVRLNGVLGAPCDWLPDSKGLLCRVVPADRGAEPKRATAPEGPDVSENLGRVSPGRTFEDLLQTPEDERFFEYYATAQLAVVPLTGSVRMLPGKGLFEEATASPDGRYALVVARHRPFSYALPVEFFPMKATVVDLKSGAVVKELADEPLADSIPIAFDAVAPGPRDFGWRSDVPSTVTWAVAGDGGDPRKKVEVHDRLFALAAPFSGEPETLLEMPMRFGRVEWGTAHLALVSERERKTRKRVMVALDPEAKTGKTIFEGSSEDRYNDPGMPVLVPNAGGQRVLRLTESGDGIYFIGQGASPEGDQPFVGVLPVSGGTVTKLWQSKAPFYEEPLAVLGEDRFLVRRESETVPPNYFVVKPGTDGATRTQVTHFASPYGATKLPTRTVLHYKRADGLELSANLWVPAGYDKSQGPLPTLMEAYPAEFKTRAAAGQVAGSPYRFPRIGWGSPVFFTATGYAVLENASIPIIGEGKEEPNDTYVDQLVAGAKAAIEHGASLGVVDPKRVAVMGHSYGAFMTANLLAHTDLFRAGIARSGAYNRSLTPYGFQNEERTYWQDPKLYFDMSPFSYADKIKTPILLIHGEADDNQGTFPIQSDRFFVALKGQGATVRLVFLPLEAHHYVAHESLDHMLWEMNRWLDTYVKPEQPVVAGSVAGHERGIRAGNP